MPTRGKYPRPRTKACTSVRRWRSKAPDRWATSSTATSAALTHCRLAPPPPPRHRRRATTATALYCLCCWLLLPPPRYRAATAKCQRWAIAVAAAALPAAAAQLPRFPSLQCCHRHRRCCHQANDAAAATAPPLTLRCRQRCRHLRFCCCHRLRR
jgi:hypothetical protein